MYVYIYFFPPVATSAELSAGYLYCPRSLTICLHQQIARMCPPPTLREWSSFVARRPVARSIANQSVNHRRLYTKRWKKKYQEINGGRVTNTYCVFELTSSGGKRREKKNVRPATTEGKRGFLNDAPVVSTILFVLAHETDGLPPTNLETWRRDAWRTWAEHKTKYSLYIFDISKPTCRSRRFR